MNSWLRLGIDREARYWLMFVRSPHRAVAKDADTHIIETIKREQMYDRFQLLNCEDLLPATSFYANISSNEKMKMHF